MNRTEIQPAASIRGDVGGPGRAGITVSDASGATRVVLGNIATQGAPDYGLKVVSSDGTTVIIDGTSNMFKIIATGTQSKAYPNALNTSATDSVTLTALGAGYTTPPACLWMSNFSWDADRTGAFFAVILLLSGSSYWGTHQVSRVGLSAGEVVMKLQVFSDDVNAGALGYTGSTRYYVLQEAGI